MTGRGHLLSTFRGDLEISHAHLYAEAIYNAGAPLERCIGFIDCTKIQMERPSGPNTSQMNCFPGAKRFHCMKYQIVITPDGLVLHMYGPEVGKWHDISLYRKSNMDAVL